MNSELNKVLKTLKRFESSDVESSLAVTPKHVCVTVDEQDWTHALALVSAAKACSSDDSGDKDTIAWGDFSKAFAWVDVKKADTFSAYEYLHHTYSGDDGELLVARLGIQTAMAKLLKDKDSDTLPMHGDCKEIYEHLKKHYEGASLEIPEFEKSYSNEELVLIAEGSWKNEVEVPENSFDNVPDSSDAKVETLEVIGITKLQKAMEDLASQMKEFEQGSSIRLGIQFDLMTSLKAKLEELNIKDIDIPDELDASDIDEKEYDQAFDKFLEKLDAATE